MQPRHTLDGDTESRMLSAVDNCDVVRHNIAVSTRCRQTTCAISPTTTEVPSGAGGRAGLSRSSALLTVRRVAEPPRTPRGTRDRGDGSCRRPGRSSRSGVTLVPDPVGYSMVSSSPKSSWSRSNPPSLYACGSQSRGHRSSERWSRARPHWRANTLRRTPPTRLHRWWPARSRSPTMRSPRQGRHRWRRGARRDDPACP